jgi:hypothetical protein
VNHLLWGWRCQAEFVAGIRVNALRVGQRGLFQAKLPIAFLQHGFLPFEFLNLVAAPHTLEMLPREQQTKKENQNAQSEETVTFTVPLRVNLAM